MSSFIPTGFYLKIEFLEIKGEQIVTHKEDATNVTGKLRDKQQMISAVITFVDFCRKYGVKFDAIAGIVEDIYLGTNTVLDKSNIATANTIEEAEEMLQKIKFDRDNGVQK